MSDNCHAPCASPASSGDANPRYRRALWVALVVNAAMFLVEIGAGLQAASVSLLADAIDFLGDAANYGLALMVLGMAPVWGSRVALVKALCMMGFGVFVLARTAWSQQQGITPEPLTMGAIGALALVANLGVAWLLYAYREGNANMRSVWLCTRNDAIGNLAVLAAALGVFGTASGWPDWVVATIMATLALTSGWRVLQLARSELRAASAS